MNDRRAFLKVALFTGGAFALGIELPGCAPPKVPSNPGDFAPNAWVRITPSNHYIFLLDRTEMGQGVATTLTTMVAEELDVDPRRFEIVTAPASRAYDNPDPNFRIQATGGSSSVRTTYLPLRNAGATARAMLRSAAAKTWGVPVAECIAADGVVRHAGSGKSATYGELAQTASTLPVPEDVPLKSPSEFRFLGKSIGRLDIRPKVDGSGVYGIDVKRPGLVNAIIVRPPSVRGTVRDFDASVAKTMTGVIDVVKVSSGVAIIATHFYQALAASKTVKATFEDAPNVGTKALHEAFHARLGRPGDTCATEGSFEDTWNAAPHKIEARYDAPYLAHAALEPMNATAHFHDGILEIWAPSQASGLAREAARKLTGLAYDHIFIHTTLIGGGFGRRAMSDFVVDAIEVAQRVPGSVPVKVTWTREDDMTHGFYRQLSAHALKGAVDAQGNLVGWFHRFVSQSLLGNVGAEFAAGILPNFVPMALKDTISRAAGGLLGTDAIRDQATIEGTAKDLPYAIQAERVEYAAVETGIPIGFWRSVGLSQNVFVVESFFDELTHLAKADPVDLRIAHLKDPRMRATLQLAADKSGWKRPMPQGHGLGVAISEGFHGYCAEVVEAHVDGDAIIVDRVVVAVDCGFVLNPDIVVAQIESAVAFALSAALYQEITFEAGKAQQTNYHQYKVLRMFEMPAIEVHLTPSDAAPTGIGEVGVPALAPALGNAIFAATGKRLRSLPFVRSLKDHP